MKAIVSCLFGDYDYLNPAPAYSGWDSILFTDSVPNDPKGWKIRHIPSNGDPRRQSREYKILLHKHLPEYEFYCYMDANMVLPIAPPTTPLWGEHYLRHKIWDEAKAVIRLNKDDEVVVNRQMVFYKNSRVRGTSVIPMNGFFCRRNSEQMNRLCEVWWEQVKQFSHRDQLGLPYAIEFTGIIPEGLRAYPYIRNYFTIKSSHKVNEVKTKVNVHHITSGRADKDIGKAINDIVRPLPEEDWICLRDIDTMPMNHREFFKQCEEIAMRGEFDLVSCMTNRIGLDYQLHNKVISNDFDISNHVKIGQELFEKHGSEVTRITQGVAGIMMMFPKRIWTKVGGFDEGGIVNEKHQFHDHVFSTKVRNAGGRVGIAKGIYLFHLYRLYFDPSNIHLY